MKDTTPIYFHSATYAYEHGELDQYHASHKANIACREAIEQAITDNYRDNRLGTACVQQVLQQFDPGRIFYVLANTVRQKDYDGRISRDNKAWAQTVPVCEDTVSDMTGMFALPWTAAIPDLPTCFSPRPGGNVRLLRNKSPLSETA